MLLEELEITEKKLKQFQKKKLNSVEDLIYRFPKKYLDFRKAKTPETAIHEEKCIMICTVMEVKKKDKYVEVVGREYKTFQRISIKWFQQPHKYYEFNNLYGMDIAVGGVYKNDEWGPQFVNPDVFTTDIRSALKITPIYSKIPGMSNDYYNQTLTTALNKHDVKDPLHL